jgi:hypothetical protein
MTPPLNTPPKAAPPVPASLPADIPRKSASNEIAPMVALVPARDVEVLTDAAAVGGMAPHSDYGPHLNGAACARSDCWCRAPEPDARWAREPEPEPPHVTEARPRLAVIED